MIDKPGTTGGKTFTSALLDGPTHRQSGQRQLQVSSKGGHTACATSTVRASFVNGPVQQPRRGNTIASVVTTAGDTRALGKSSPGVIYTRSSGGANMGKRRRPSNTHGKTKNSSGGKDRSSSECSSGCHKLRLNQRGEYCCTSCGRAKSDSRSSMHSLVGTPLKKLATESDDSKSSKERSDTSNVKKLPALLDLPSNLYQLGPVASAPVPLISLPSTFGTLIPTATTTAPLSLFDLMAQHRRPYSSAACNCKKDTGEHYRHQHYSRADYVRGADLKLADSATETAGSKRSRGAKGDKSSAAPTNRKERDDLKVLHQQRADINRRIAKLQKEEEEGRGSDCIAYVSGYYCHVCKRFLGEDSAERQTHCQEQTHLDKLANTSNHIETDDVVNQDSDSLFKYYEERYDGIAFDDNDVKADQAHNDSDVSMEEEEEKEMEDVPNSEISPCIEEDTSQSTPPTRKQSEEVKEGKRLDRTKTYH